MASTRDRRMLVVVAHPDDETFGCGSLLLAAADAGVVTSVVCATRGEVGEAVDGTPPERLGEVREAETRAAARLMDVSEVHFLYFVDSGMAGDADPGTLVGAPFDAVRDAVAEHVDRFRPDVVIGLDATDGHRDHARIGEATIAAVESADHRVDALYLFCLPQELMARWVEYMSSTDPSWEQLRDNVPGTPPDQIHAVLDTTQQLGRREAAIAMHRSQRTPFDGLPDDLYRAFLTSEHLRRVHPTWHGGPRQTHLSDLFRTSPTKEKA